LHTLSLIKRFEKVLSGWERRYSQEPCEIDKKMLKKMVMGLLVNGKRMNNPFEEKLFYMVIKHTVTVPQFITLFYYFPLGFI
jgi:hypothetical protein